MFQLDLKSRKSIYEQVVDNFKGLIISEVLSQEEKLPSVRDLSRSLTVNPNTVQKAYRELERQGYIYTVSGLGTFVADKNEIEVDTVRITAIKNELRHSIKELYYLGLTKQEATTLISEIFNEGSGRK
ncbi:MAG: GntR family transcriptional regulator [Eubacteriales bacterium]|nr:GntR family transcriptional regulator [Eubacteriales bacterium]MDD4389318.1 GntR family transcriptional regulator [Eubacteriales bacterium]